MIKFMLMKNLEYNKIIFKNRIKKALAVEIPENFYLSLTFLELLS